MRTLCLAAAFLLVLIQPSAFADDVTTFPLPGKTIVVTKDFCEICMCCTKAQRFPVPEDRLSQSFGTTDFPPLMKREMNEAWQEMISKPTEMSPEVYEDIISGTSVRALKDICEICGCCIETPDALILDYKEGNMPNLQEFQLFVE